MAWAQKKGDSWYCEFRYKGKRHYFTIGEVSEIEARATVAKVDYLLMRLKQHLLDVPADCDIVTFLQYDGKPPAPILYPDTAPFTLEQLRDEYMECSARPRWLQPLHANGVKRLGRNRSPAR
jgi:hypothetical protein